MSETNLERVKNSISDVLALTEKAKSTRIDILASSNKNIAKNRIARFVIYSFCITVVAFVLFILYGVIFTSSQSWKDAINPIMDILQKIFLPIVTLAFGFYNSTDKD